MKKTILLLAAAIFLLLPFSAFASAPGGPIHLDLGIGWSASLNSYTADYYKGTESQGPHFILGLKFRVHDKLMLGVDASLAVQPWNYGYEYDYSYGYEGVDYTYDVSVKSRLFFSGDVTLTFYPEKLFYVMVGAGFSGMNLSYETGYDRHSGSSFSSMDGTEYGWNGLIALGINIPLAPFFRIGFEARYQGGYITSGPELYDFSLFSGNVMLSFL